MLFDTHNHAFRVFGACGGGEYLHRCEFLEDADNAGRAALAPSAAQEAKRTSPPRIGVQAIEHHRKRVRFFSTVELVNALEQEKLQGKPGQIAARLTHSDLVILDELGYLPSAPPAEPCSSIC